MIEEILELGFTHIELGYDTRMDLVPGIRRMVEQKAVTVGSVHNFCPLPMTAHRAHPEIFTFGDKDRRIRSLAVAHTTETIRFAAELGARVVVTHCGNIEMQRLSSQLVGLCEQQLHYTPAYENIKLKLQMKREKRAGKQIGYWRKCLQELLPVLEEYKIQLGMENMPTWEAIPTESELETTLRQFQSPWLRYWHDMGHGQIRENLGLINVERWLDRLSPYLAGMHVHDVMPPACDHVMPPRGSIDFSRYKRFADRNIVRVIEPTPRTPAEDIREALTFLKDAWGATGQDNKPNEQDGQTE
jgi:sugar phosphate isomerase/epimerase